jgi:hypothetical protein
MYDDQSAMGAMGAMCRRRKQGKRRGEKKANDTTTTRKCLEEEIDENT